MLKKRSHYCSQFSIIVISSSITSACSASNSTTYLMEVLVTGSSQGRMREELLYFVSVSICEDDRDGWRIVSNSCKDWIPHSTLTGKKAWGECVGDSHCCLVGDWICVEGGGLG